MLKHTASKILSLLFLSLVFVSCQKNDTDLLQEAQSCLNDSPSSEARNCVSKISNLNSAPALKLRCAAIFIHEGFGSATTFLNALNDLSAGSSNAGCSGGSCSSTLLVMNKFNFSSGDNSVSVAGNLNRSKNLATADEALEICAASESKAYTQVSSIFKLGTLATMGAYAAGANPNQAPTLLELETAAANMPTAQVGELAYLTYNETCVGNQNTSSSTVQYCSELQTAINDNGTNYTAIGTCLKSRLNDPSFVCP